MQLIIDAHCHASLNWYEPVSALLHQMDAHGVEKAVLVQVNGHFDNAYQNGWVRRAPDRFASVVLIDAARRPVDNLLEKLVEEGAVGLRLYATDRSPGEDPWAIWQAAAGLGLSVSVGGRTVDFLAAAFRELLTLNPGLTLTIEHMAGRNLPDPEETAELRRQVFQLIAPFPNVFLKIHGFGELAQRAATLTHESSLVDPPLAVLESALLTLGSGRILWGSDYPSVSDREGYANALKWPMDAIASLAPEGARSVFGETAKRLYFPDAQRL
jgi:L-fuconolactonase